MPRLSDKITINNPLLDRRYKITEKDREAIKSWHGKISIRAIARLFPHISRRSIQFILFPERKQKVADRAKEVKRWTKYNKKEYHTPVQRKHRAYKKQLYVTGLLTKIG